MPGSRGTPTSPLASRPDRRLASTRHRPSAFPVGRRLGLTGGTIIHAHLPPAGWVFSGFPRWSRTDRPPPSLRFGRSPEERPAGSRCPSTVPWSATLSFFSPENCRWQVPMVARFFQRTSCGPISRTLTIDDHSARTSKLGLRIWFRREWRFKSSFSHCRFGRRSKARVRPICRGSRCWSGALSSCGDSTRREPRLTLPNPTLLWRGSPTRQPGAPPAPDHQAFHEAHRRSVWRSQRTARSS